MSTYYSDSNEHCIQWIENLVNGGMLTAGVVDE